MIEIREGLVSEIGVSKRLRLVAKQQCDIAGFSLLLQQAQAQPGAVNRIGILPPFSVCRGRRQTNPPFWVRRPIRAKAYGKKREHGPDSSDSGSDRVLPAGQRPNIACNHRVQLELDAMLGIRPGVWHATNQECNAGDDIACNTSSTIKLALQMPVPSPNRRCATWPSRLRARR